MSTARLIAALEVAVKVACDGGWWTRAGAKTVHAEAVEAARTALEQEYLTVNADLVALRSEVAALREERDEMRAHVEQIHADLKHSAEVRWGPGGQIESLEKRALAAEAEVERLRREKADLLDTKPRRDRMFDAEAWDGAMAALGAMTKERDEALAALNECQQQTADDGPCWCCIPSMIPYRGHDSGCEAASAVLARG
jgi:septal ring factor EnvC (AmiA/AmiB activator)